jgi:hypothetical protein
MHYSTEGGTLPKNQYQQENEPTGYNLSPTGNNNIGGYVKPSKDFKGLLSDSRKEKGSD